MVRTRKPLGVFCGPSLQPEDRIARTGVTYLPPASRGDVECNVEHFDALLMLDGVFHHDLAPSPKEVYAACSMTTMFGASSMGALRAAECWPYGMTALGIIARWYIAQRIDGDDEVAVLVHPQTQKAMTVPLVNVRHAAWLARRRGILSEAQASQWIGRARAIFYMDRTWPDVLSLLPAQARAHVATIAWHESDLKGIDARFALRSVLRRLEL